MRAHGCHRKTDSLGGNAVLRGSKERSANPQSRVWPHDLVEDDHYAAFFGYLRKNGYSERISIEGEGSFEKDGKATREFFRQAVRLTETPVNAE